MNRVLIPVCLLMLSTSACVSAEMIADADEKLAKAEEVLVKTEAFLADVEKTATDVHTFFPTVNAEVKKLAEERPEMKAFAEKFDDLSDRMMHFADKIKEHAPELLDKIRDALKGVRKARSFISGLQSFQFPPLPGTPGGGGGLPAGEFGILWTALSVGRRLLGL